MIKKISDAASKITTDSQTSASQFDVLASEAQKVVALVDNLGSGVYPPQNATSLLADAASLIQCNQSLTQLMNQIKPAEEADAKFTGLVTAKMNDSLTQLKSILESRKE